MMSGRGETAWKWATIFGFVAFGLMAVAVRSHAPLRIIEELRMGAKPMELELLEFDGTFPVALRVGAAFVYAAVYYLLSAIAHLMMVSPETFPFYRPPPSDWPVKTFNAREFFGVIVPFFSVYLYKLILLTPGLAVVQVFFRTWRIRFFALVLLLLTVGGWPPLLVNGLFAAMENFFSWPRAYYNFAHDLLPGDFASLGFVLGLTALIAIRERIGLGIVALSAALGQVCFEHLGFVAGVSLALAAWLGGAGKAVAFARLSVAGVVSAALLGIMVAALLQSPQAMPETAAGGGRVASFLEYLHRMWTINGANNYVWYNVTLANLASLLMFPVFFGAIIGLAARQSCPLPSQVANTRLYAVFSVWTAFLLALLIGSLVSGFYPDMGRQMLPFLCLSALLSGAAVQAIPSSPQRA